MKRLLSLAATAFLLTACGGAAAVMTSNGVAKSAVSPSEPVVPIEVSTMTPMDIIDMQELVIEAPGVTQEIQSRQAPQFEDRFFYVIPVSLDEAPRLPPPPGPVDH